MFTKSEIEDLNNRIEAGIRAAHKKLIEDYKRSNDKLVISRNGKIEFVSPYDLDKKPYSRYL